MGLTLSRPFASSQGERLPDVFAITEVRESIAVLVWPPVPAGQRSWEHWLSEGPLPAPPASHEPPLQTPLVLDEYRERDKQRDGEDGALKFVGHRMQALPAYQGEAPAGRDAAMGDVSCPETNGMRGHKGRGKGRTVLKKLCCLQMRRMARFEVSRTARCLSRLRYTRHLAGYGRLSATGSCRGQGHHVRSGCA